jgi:hypothetical protein
MSRPNRIVCALRGFTLILLLVLCGCASYSNSFGPIAAELAAQDTERALDLLTKTKTPERNRLLYLMDRGMLLSMNGEFVASSQEFAEAKKLVEKLNALSLREQTTALTINDGTSSYAGAPYEQVMLNLYSALNYLELGQLDEARVEALQVDLLLGELGDKEVGPLFADNPFARYLTALIYEAGGEWSDAMIAYRSAYQAYLQHRDRYPLNVPRQLEFDLLRASEAVGLKEENRQYAADFAIDSWQSADQLSDQGELIFLFHNGLAPVKVEQAIMVPVPSRNLLVRVALPTYLRRPPGFSAARLRIGGREVQTEAFASIEELAIAELKRNQPAILARATARAMVKYQMSNQAGKENELAGLLVNISGLLTERADTRSWLSLPASIQLARVALPPGVYDLEVELLDAAGQPARKLFYPATRLVSGRKTFISCHEVAVGSLLGRH